MREDAALYMRTRALVQTKWFLQALATPAETPRVPRTVRLYAKALLKHYLTLQEIERIHKALPDLLGPAPPFSRLSGNRETVNVIQRIRDAQH